MPLLLFKGGEMIFTSLTLEGFRNLAAQSLTFHPQFNLIIGANGSGKTSLLEALYFVAQVKSFRTNRPNQLIALDNEQFRLFARLTDGRQDAQVGIERQRGGIEIRKDFEPVKRRSELVKLLPILFIGPDSGQLLQESPTFRRNFLDWGLFQNNPKYHALWLRYDRALKQRNSALKNQYSDSVLNALEQELAEAGDYLTAERVLFTQQLSEQLYPFMAQFFTRDQRWQLEYRSGIPERFETLLEALKSSRDRDRKRGYTHVGPHRGDFLLKAEGHDVGQIYSRGQMKLTTIALMLAQIALHKDQQEEKTILLMDDLTAELDYHHRALLVHQLLQLNAQLFITALESEEFPELEEGALVDGAYRYELSGGKAQKVV